MMESFGTINNNFYPSDFRLWYKVNKKESRKRDWPCSGVFIAQMQKQPLKEFYEKVVLKKFTKFTGKHLRWSLLWNSESLQLHHRCFPMNFSRFLRTVIPKNISRWLLLSLYHSNVMFYPDWYHLNNLKNVENVHGWVLHSAVWNLTKSIIPPWVFHVS